jgi:hypothetical protein
MAQYLNIDEFFEEGEKLDAESHIAFYDWMQNFQDISGAKRALEVDTDVKLYNKFLEYKYDKSDKS